MRRFSSIQFAGIWLVLWLCPEPALGQCQSWSQEIGTSIAGTADALLAFDDGSGPVLWVGGDVAVGAFPSAYVARWNGTQWMYTPGFDDAVTSFGVFDDGNGPSLYAGGLFDVGTYGRGIAQWDGTDWVPLGGALGNGLFGGQSVWASAMTTFDSGNGAELYIGGAFHGGGATDSFAIIKWDGMNWLSVGGGLGPTTGNQVAQVYALQVFDDGTGAAVYVAGKFTTAGGASVHGIARWNGMQWSAVGTGADGPDNVAYSLAVFDDGGGPALYSYGSFQSAGSNLARWDGTNWTGIPNPLGVGLNGLFAFDDGTGPALFAAGYYLPRSNVAVAKWDGHDWSALGSGLGPANSGAFALGSFDEGLGHGPELFVGGSFMHAGGDIQSQAVAKWISCTRPIESMCVGDNSLAKCPCGNVGLLGHGCNNSIATGGALLASSGTTTPDTLVLTSSGELATALSVVLQGTSTSEFVTAFGDGLRCIGGNVLRLFVKTARGGAVAVPSVGDPPISARSAQLGDPIAAGSVRYYQVYYRDPSPAFCSAPRGGPFNMSNGMRIVW